MTSSKSTLQEETATLIGKIKVRTGPDSMMSNRCTSLHKLAYPFRFDFTVKSSLEKAEIERKRKGKQIVADDGERFDLGTVASIRELGEASYMAAEIRDQSGEQIIDIANLLSGQSGETLSQTDQEQLMNSIYKESLLSSRNIIALVMILLATVGWSTGLNPPGGINNEGEATVGKKTAFLIFMLAVYTMVPVCLITLGLLCGVTPKTQKVQRNTLKVCHAFMWIGLISFALAFVSGTWLIVPSDKWWLKMIGALTTLAGMIVIISYIWLKQARKLLRRLSFCDLDGSSDEDEAAAPMVTRNINK